ncbi:MAG TPA: cupredoxin domain-containing protein [Dehalococcoidia bacterium]|jgi:plastocyanin
MPFHPRRPFAVLVAAAAIALTLSAAAAHPRPTRAQEAVLVTMVNNQYTPATITIAAGTAVTWVNSEDPNAADNVHDVIADDYTSWSSNYINPGETFSQEFDTPGTYHYLCDLHTAMEGTIVVQ